MNADGIGSPFHAGEREAQKRAGVQSAGGAIRDFMPDQHRTFFGLLPFLPITTTDQDGWPVATILTGSRGFISSPDPRTLCVGSLPVASDPASPHLIPGNPVGILGIDLGTRRRNRANGVIAAKGPNGLVISVYQSFGNCPQYIQVRELQTTSATSQDPEMMDRFDEQARAEIGVADTFFVATSSGSIAAPMGGVDISHRGGPKGFVRVAGSILTIPDYRGNRYFNTLGNILLNPRVALLFVNFDTGDLLHVQGKAEILWDSQGESEFEGAERSWRVHVARAWRRSSALPFRWL
jgi:predicted pyridoxine 5'-phosphate oxidase superfamily flavin-nucleotide-binding protein